MCLLKCPALTMDRHPLLPGEKDGNTQEEDQGDGAKKGRETKRRITELLTISLDHLTQIKNNCSQSAFRFLCPECFHILTLKKKIPKLYICPRKFGTFQRAKMIKFSFRK